MSGLQLNFNVGNAFLFPAGATPTSMPFGALQELNFDITMEEKEFYAGSTFPLDVALGKGSIKGTAKMGQINGSLLASITPGAVASTGQTIGVPGETTGTISGATYTVTNPTGFSDVVVKDDTGAAMKRVASSATAGQYSVTSGGVYTFDSSATGKVFTIIYTYTTSSSGTTVEIGNALMGSAPAFALVNFNQFRSLNSYFMAYKVSIPKLSFPMKMGEYTVQDLSFSCFDDGTGKVARICRA